MRSTEDGLAGTGGGQASVRVWSWGRGVVAALGRLPAVHQAQLSFNTDTLC